MTSSEIRSYSVSDPSGSGNLSKVRFAVLDSGADLRAARRDDAFSRIRAVVGQSCHSQRLSVRGLLFRSVRFRHRAPLSAPAFRTAPPISGSRSCVLAAFILCGPSGACRFRCVRIAQADGAGLAGEGAPPFSDGNSIGELISQFAASEWGRHGCAPDLEQSQLEHFGGVLDLSSVRSGRFVARPPPLDCLRSGDRSRDGGDLCVVAELYGYDLASRPCPLPLGWLLVRCCTTFWAGTRCPPSGCRHHAHHPLPQHASNSRIGAILGFVALAGKGPGISRAMGVCAGHLRVQLRRRCGQPRSQSPGFSLWLRQTLSYGIYMVHIFVQARMINAASVLCKADGSALRRSVLD